MAARRLLWSEDVRISESFELRVTALLGSQETPGCPWNRKPLVRFALVRSGEEWPGTMELTLRKGGWEACSPGHDPIPGFVSREMGKFLPWAREDPDLAAVQGAVRETVNRARRAALAAWIQAAAADLEPELSREDVLAAVDELTVIDVMGD